MAIAKLTIIGLHQYSSGSIWNGLVFPEGINKEEAINQIIYQCGEFPLLHPDGEFMQGMITSWGKKWYRNFERWALAASADYNPLYNVEASITIKDKSDSTSSGNSEAINQVSAYDSSAFQNRDKLNGTNSGESHSTNEHTEDRHGNIGVTQSTQLLLGEVDYRKWNIYNEIANCFAVEFCIPVYD